MPRESDFIDRIYEAGAIGDFWPNVLHELGAVAGGRGSVMLVADPASTRWVASAGIQDLIADWFREGWYRHNTRGDRLQASQSAGFVREIDIYDSREHIESDPNIKDFLRPRGMGWAAGTIIPVPSGDNLLFSIEREFRKGPVGDTALRRLNELRPHLARAALFSARLGLERARAMAEAMQTIGLPAAVLRRGGVLSAANSLFEKLIPAVVADRQNRITLANRESDRLLERAISSLDRGIKQGQVFSIAVPAGGDRAPMALHIVPVCGAAHDIFSRAVSILIATPVDRTASPTAELLQGLFDLTPAEAKVARAIARAQSIEAIATAHHVTAETVRGQIKAIFMKTGTSRQAELTRLLTGLAMPIEPQP